MDDTSGQQPDAAASMAVEKETLPDAPPCEEPEAAHETQGLPQQPAADGHHDDLQVLADKCSHVHQQYEQDLLALVGTVHGQATQGLEELLLQEVNARKAELSQALESKYRELEELRNLNDQDEARLQQCYGLCQSLSSIAPPPPA